MNNTEGEKGKYIKDEMEKKEPVFSQGLASERDFEALNI
jgi:hypothetical protein